MVNIIKRVEGERHKSETVTGAKVQVSYNDWGHLCVRVIHEPAIYEDDDIASRQVDTLIVFDKATSERIIRFCKRMYDNNGIPFAEFISIAREALPYWLKRVQELEAENARLREDMDFLKQEYRDSEEPMTDDAIELQARLKILQERDELRAENRRLRSAIESARDSLTLSVADESMDRDAWTELALKTLEKALEVRE